VPEDVARDGPVLFRTPMFNANYWPKGSRTGRSREFLTSIQIIAPSPVIEAPRLLIFRPKSGCAPNYRANVDKLDNFGIATHKLRQLLLDERS